MRLALAALTLLLAAAAAAAQPAGTDGPVGGGAFGMGGADYYGEVRDGPAQAIRRPASPAGRGRRPARRPAGPARPPRR